MHNLKQAGSNTRQGLNKRSQALGENFTHTGGHITKALADQNLQADALSTRWEVRNSAEVRAMEPLCWSATERTAGMFPCAMSGNSEDIIDHLDLCDLQLLRQGERGRYFHLLHTTFLQKYFIDVERSIDMAAASELHRECVRTDKSTISQITCHVLKRVQRILSLT